jgi:hypothetical protein
MYSINDTVRVRFDQKPVLGEDEKTDMRGWQGVVTEVERFIGHGEYITVSFDSYTLRAFPRKYLMFCAQLDQHFWLASFKASEIEKVPARDKPSDRERAKNLLLASETWVQMHASWVRISALLIKVREESEYLDAWWTFLEEEFKDPVRAMYVGPAFDQIYFGAEVTVTEILDFDLSWGVFVQVDLDGNPMDIPLYMLEIMEEGARTLALRDYALWHIEEYIPEHMGRFRGFGASDQ